MSDDGVQAIYDGCPSLISIDLSNCCNVKTRAARAAGAVRAARAASCSGFCIYFGNSGREFLNVELLNCAEILYLFSQVLIRNKA